MFVLVIGAGVIGVSIADALARRGAQVTVLDMRSPGRGASQASAGILAPYTEAHHDSPLLPLGIRSLDLFDAFVADASARSGRPVEYARTGTLEVALNDEDAVKLHATSAWLDCRGVPHESLDAQSVHGLEPAVTTSAIAGLLVPGHRHVGVASLVGALTHSARLNGACFESPVEAAGVECMRDHVLVRAGDRRYSADAVVIASGSWAQRIRVKGVAPLPVRPLRGQLLHLRWTGPNLPGRVAWGPRCYAVRCPTACRRLGRSTRTRGSRSRRDTTATASCSRRSRRRSWRNTCWMALQIPLSSSRRPIGSRGHETIGGV
jgi:glycine oxidase